MFRGGFIYVLIVAVVIGPQWCCCAAGRCFAGTATSTTDRLPVPGCCAGAKQSDSPGSREPSSCRCKHRPRQAVLNASSPAVMVQEFGSLTVADFLNPFVADGNAVLCSRRPLAEVHFSGWQSESIAGSRDLLRALPVMRC